MPVKELPPAILLTDQVTAELADPVTVAVNCWALPVLTLTGLGETETWICLGSGCCGVVPEPEPRTAAHPASSIASTGKSVGSRRFKESSPLGLPRCSLPFRGGWAWPSGLPVIGKSQRASASSLSPKIMRVLAAGDDWPNVQIKYSLLRPLLRGGRNEKFLGRPKSP